MFFSREITRTCFCVSEGRVGSRGFVALHVQFIALQTRFLFDCESVHKQGMWPTHQAGIVGKHVRWIFSNIVCGTMLGGVDPISEVPIRVN